MKKQVFSQSLVLLGLFGLSVLLLGSCKNGQKKETSLILPGKVILVCDDWNVDNWYSFLDSFEKYDMRLTFYVSHFHEMNAHKKRKLLELQNCGHEIAYHTLNHSVWDTNATQAEIDNYLKVEIDSGLNLLRSSGFNVNNFAFPGERYSSSIFRLISSRFKHVRAGHFGYFDYGARRREYQLTPNKNTPFWSYAIDNASLFDTDRTMDLIVEDLLAGKNVALLFHSLTYEPILYTTNPEKFFRFMNLIKSNGVEFTTVSRFYAQSKPESNTQYRNRQGVEQ